MNTTAGSYSLLGSVVTKDAGVVKRLRAAGAIILGKLRFLRNSASNNAMQERLIYLNSPILEENLPLDGQEEVANVRTPITSMPTPVALLLVLE